MYRYATAVCYHDAFDIFRFADHSFGTDIVCPVDFLYITASRILVIAAQSGVDIADRNIQRIQGIGVDRHFILFQVSSEAIDLHNSRNTGKLPLDDPILYRAQLHRIVFILITGSHLQYILINLAQPGCDRHQLGRPQLRGNLTGYGLYLFIDQLPGIQCRYALLEDHRHERQPETGDGTYLLHIHNITHGNFDRESNQLLDFLRGKGRRDGHDLYLIIGDIGHGIDRQRQHRVNPSGKQEQGGECDKQLFADRKMYYSFKHYFVILNNITKLTTLKKSTYNKRVKLTDWELKCTYQPLKEKGKRDERSEQKNPGKDQSFVFLKGDTCCN